MRPSLRFLGLAVFGWAGLRAAALGVLPGADLFQVERSEAKPPPLVPTRIPSDRAIAPAAPVAPVDYPHAPDAATSRRPRCAMSRRCWSAGRDRPGVVAGLPAAAARERPTPICRAPRSTRFAAIAAAQAVRHAELPPLGQGRAGIAGPVSRPGPSRRRASALVDPRRLDRLQLTTWALLRSQQAGIAGSRSLASGGQLGASQAGARLIYNFDRRLALRRPAELRGRAARRRSSGRRAHPAVRQHSGLGHCRAAPGASADMAVAATPSRCSPKAGSTTARCRGSSAWTLICRAGWSG